MSDSSIFLFNFYFLTLIVFHFVSLILRHVAEVFPPARQGTILNSHRVIGIATNTSMVLNCALVLSLVLHNDDSRCRTAGCSLTSYPRTNKSNSLPVILMRCSTDVWRPLLYSNIIPKIVQSSVINVDRS